MYIPKHFEETDTEALCSLIRSAPLATLVVNTRDGLIANHIPFVLDVDDAGPTRLRAHIPRANPLSSTLATATDCIAIFHGAEGYISPSLYATKKEHGNVVPTWNYAVVHAHGAIQVVDSLAWVLAQIQALTEQNEHSREHPWAVSDAPKEFTDRLAKSLVGLELRIERLVGKTKASQNQPPQNQKSVLEALKAEPSQAELWKLMHAVLGNPG
jgi:transcriptional regulator